MKIMGKVARLILLVVVSVCDEFFVLCCLQNNPVFSSVTILSHISKNEKYELCILAGFFVMTRNKSSSRLEKKSSSLLSGGCAIILTTGKKKIQPSVWRVRDHYYDQKKNNTVFCLVGARSLLQLEKKKDTVVCLAGVRSLLRP